MRNCHARSSRSTLTFTFRTPHSAFRISKSNAPGTPQRRPTSLSAAPCEGLTRFTTGRPADLGHRKLVGQGTGEQGQTPLRPRASGLVEPALHGVHARVQGLVAGGVGGVEDPSAASRSVVREPATLYRRQVARQPSAGQLTPREQRGPLGETAHDLSQRISDHVEARGRRRPRRAGLRRSGNAGGGGRGGGGGTRRSRGLGGRAR